MMGYYKTIYTNYQEATGHNPNFTSRQWYTQPVYKTAKCSKCEATGFDYLYKRGAYKPLFCEKCKQAE